MKASLNRERCRKHSSPKEEERDEEPEEKEEEEGELDDKESPPRCPPRSPLLALNSGTTVSMAGERSSAGKDNGGGGEASGEMCAWSWECSSREMFLNLCRVQ